MTYCKGKNCRYRQQCARYSVRLKEHESDTWIDHCINGKKFIKCEADDLERIMGFRPHDQEW